MHLIRIVTVLAFALSAASAVAQSYPSKPIRWILGFPPGGSGDVLCRMLGAKLSEALDQPVIVENRSGAAGNIGMELAAKSPPDGHTIAFVYSGTHSINPSLYTKMPFAESDFAPVIWLSSVPLVLVVPASQPVTTLKELIALAKTKPGQLSFGSAGSGAINHLAGELFSAMAGTQLVHVPYRGGGPATAALLGGDITMIFSEPASIVPHIKAGKLRPIAVTSGRRGLLMPELATVAEGGVPDYDVTAWNGVHVPAGTPAEIIKRLNTEFNKIITAPEMRTRMIASGFEPVGGEPERLSELIRTETTKWAKVVKATGMKVD